MRVRLRTQGGAGSRSEFGRGRVRVLCVRKVHVRVGQQGIVAMKCVCDRIESGVTPVSHVYGRRYRTAMDNILQFHVEGT